MFNVIRLSTVCQLVLIVLGLAASGPPAVAQEATPAGFPVADWPETYLLPETAMFPEGIAYQPSTGDLFVGSLADGAVYRGNVARRDTELFLPAGADGRTSATGVKVDTDGHLFVAGGSTGLVFVYDAATGALLARLAAADASEGATPTFINDLALTPSGDAYVTDSFRPILYRVTRDDAGTFAVEDWLDLADAGIAYGDGFNLNGIVATSDDRSLIAVQSNTGALLRIDVATKTVTELDLGGMKLTGGDGLVLDGQVLFVARNQPAEVARVELVDDLRSGTVTDHRGDPSFAFPTTIVVAGDRMLVVNSQFDRQGGPAAADGALPPDVPFTVTSLPHP